MTDELDHEPIPTIPWAEAAQRMKPIRAATSLPDFIEAFIAIVTSDGSKCSVNWRAKSRPRKRRR